VPARLKNQIAPERIILLPAAQALKAATQSSADATPPVAVPTAVAAPAGPAPTVLACVELVNVAVADGRRVDTLLAPLQLGQRLVRTNVTVPEVSSHIVFIPPQGSKEAADRKAAELKNLGVTNYFVMSDNTPMKWAISLGVFKSPNAAQTLLAALNRQGVVGARVAQRNAQIPKLTYRLRELDPQTRARFDALRARLPAHEEHTCAV
jgi:cell division septation protein DedD